MELLIFDLVCAWVLDLLIGDPAWLPHPVSAVGGLIGVLDKAWYPGPRAHTGAFLAGLALASVTVGITAGAVVALLVLAWCIHPVLFHILNVYFLFAALAGRCLDLEARKVMTALDRGSDDARRALAGLVSRDTTTLAPGAIIRATVETVAENTVDGALSPLFWVLVGLGVGSVVGGAGSLWLLLLPAGLAWGFKAASTLDSRVGYKTERYLYFGRASARLDDALNFVPARLALLFIPLAACFLRLNPVRSFTVGWRDRLKHQSPNSAHAESAVAGALGIQLGGPSVYFGRLEDKPTLGDDRRPPVPRDIAGAVHLLHGATALFLVAGIAAVWAVGR